MSTRKQNQAGRGRRKTVPSDPHPVQRDLWILRGRRALLECLLFVGHATADDLRDLIELPPELNPTCFGGIPGALVKAGVIRRAGFTPTCRPTGHSRPIAVWILADRAAAERWLLDHPDRPDDDDGAAAQQTSFDLNQETVTPTEAAAGAAV